MARTAFAAPFESLRLPPYRWFAIGTLCFQGANQMQVIARGWLVYQMTSSPFTLGLVTSAWFISVVIFAPLGGVVADRVPKVKIIVATELFLAAVALIVTLLIYMNAVQIWHLVVASLLGGAAFGLNAPARQSLIPDLVGRPHLLNAFALSVAGFNLMQILAPSLAAFAVSWLGIAGAYVLTVGLFVFGMATRFFIPMPLYAPRKEKQAAWNHDLMLGLSYMKRHPALPSLLLVSTLVTMLAAPHVYLLPAYTREALAGEVEVLGWLTSSSGVGAMVAVLWIAGRPAGKSGMAIMVTALLTGMFIALLGLSNMLPLSLVALLVIGAAFSLFSTLTSTSVQMTVSDEMRGRVVSFLGVGPGLLALGLMPIGGVAQRLGTSTAYLLEGGILAAAALSFIIFLPKLRKL